MGNWIKDGYDRAMKAGKGPGRLSKLQRRWTFEGRLAFYANEALKYLGAVVDGTIKLSKENIEMHYARAAACKYVLDQYLGKPPMRVSAQLTGSSPITQIQIVTAAMEAERLEKLAGAGEIKELPSAEGKEAAGAVICEQADAGEHEGRSGEGDR